MSHSRTQASAIWIKINRMAYRTRVNAPKGRLMTSCVSILTQLPGYCSQAVGVDASRGSTVSIPVLRRRDTPLWLNGYHTVVIRRTVIHYIVGTDNGPCSKVVSLKFGQAPR